jgi:putative ATP-dependent endonuclease of the OLD family
VYLTRLVLTNFRCFERIEFSVLDRLAILVGENDAGKTVVLDAIAALIGGAPCREDDFRRTPTGVRADEIIIEGQFALEAHDTLPAEYRSDDPSTFYLRRRYTPALAETFASVLGFEDADYDDFNGAERQKELLRRAGLAPGSNEAARREQFAELVSSGELTRNTAREIKLASNNVIASFLPRIERIASIEYRSPDSVIQRTLQAAAASVIAPTDPTTGQPKERSALRAMRNAITERLNVELNEARHVLQEVHPRLIALTVVPNIDFARAITTTSLTVNIGDGDRLLSGFGEGTKKRLWMGLLEWEQRVNRANLTGSVIRLYDEPDVNLHYEAQRQLFTSIADLACDASLRTQCFVCTHAVTLIDRAPCESVNLIQLDREGGRRLCRMEVRSDIGVMGFFNEVGHSLGLTNTALLYERGFLLVEGTSEEVSIPIIYRSLFGRSLIEDGIVLVNLHTCSAWRSVVEVMLRNRLGLTHLLLDADCLQPASSARITARTLADLGCPATFIRDQVSFIGTKEFEDAFTNDVLARVLDDAYPREDGDSWTAEVSQIRLRADAGEKFSAALHHSVRHQCVPKLRSEATKPGISAAIAHGCSSSNEYPSSIVFALTAVRNRAGARHEGWQ